MTDLSVITHTPLARNASLELHPAGEERCGRRVCGRGAGKGLPAGRRRKRKQTRRAAVGGQLPGAGAAARAHRAQRQRLRRGLWRRRLSHLKRLAERQRRVGCCCSGCRGEHGELADARKQGMRQMRRYSDAALLARTLSCDELAARIARQTHGRARAAARAACWPAPAQLPRRRRCFRSPIQRRCFRRHQKASCQSQMPALALHGAGCAAPTRAARWTTCGARARRRIRAAAQRWRGRARDAGPPPPSRRAPSRPW